jgi:glycosyltransferase involved in cell wall biosynthesis
MIEALHRAGVLIVEQGGRGGVSDYTGCLAAGLAQLGVPVTIATAEDHLYPPMPGVQVAPIFAYVRGHSPLARLVRRAGLGRVANGLRFLASMPRLVKLARRHAITHLQGWEAPSLGLIATLLLRAAGVKLVYTAHNTFDRFKFSLNGTLIFPALSDQTIVHTLADRDRVPGSPVVIPHGHYGSLADGAGPTDPGLARTQLGIPGEVPVVLMFGYVRPDKGLTDLARAVAQVPPWHLLIAGQDDGGLEAAAGALAAPELSGRVTIREGFHDIDLAGAFFAAADLVALPYAQASQSGVLLLAYGFARPVVVYPVGGLIEAVQQDSTGWVAERATPEALAAVLREAGEAGREQLRARGERGRQWAEQQFDWTRIAETTKDVYETILGDAGRRASLVG